MKNLVIVGLAVGLGAGGWWLASPDRTDGARTTCPPDTTHPPDPPTSTLTDSNEVFRKAFWKRPAANDKVLHAERREWADAAGVLKWQWFIAVEPSPELLEHLCGDNAFSLTPAATVPVIAGAPAWFGFQAADVEVMQAPHGNMRLIFSKTKRLLHATDAGGGFARGVEAPANPPEALSANPGRLPSTPPPSPERP